MNTEHISKKVAELLLQINAVKLNPEQPFTWASGWKSPIYCDNRVILSYPDIRKQIVEFITAYIKNYYPDTELIAGVATGGIGVGVLVAEMLNLPFIYVRPEPKKHGRQNQIEGFIKTNQKTVVIEDLISTGMSSINAVKALRDSHLQVLGMIAIFSYGFNVAKENFSNEQIHLHTLSEYNSLLKKANEMNYISENELNTLQKWRVSPETWKS